MKKRYIAALAATTSVVSATAVLYNLGMAELKRRQKENGSITEKMDLYPNAALYAMDFVAANAAVGNYLDKSTTTMREDYELAKFMYTEFKK